SSAPWSMSGVNTTLRSSSLGSGTLPPLHPAPQPALAVQRVVVEELLPQLVDVRLGQPQLAVGPVGRLLEADLRSRYHPHPVGVDLDALRQVAVPALEPSVLVPRVEQCHPGPRSVTGYLLRRLARVQKLRHLLAVGQRTVLVL